MERYQCIRCGYKTNVLFNFNKHINKKKECLPKLSNVLLSENLNMLLNFCNFCGKNYKAFSNLEEHNKTCALKINYDKQEKEKKEKDDEMYKMKKKLEKLEIELNEIKNDPSKIINNQINNNQINNNQLINNQLININVNLGDNIKLNDYDNCTSDHITRKFLFDFIQTTDNLNLLPLIFEKIFFSEEMKNHSIISIDINGKQKIFTYKKNRIQEMSNEDFNKFIIETFNNRYKLSLRKLLGNSYDNLSEEEQNILGEDEFNLILSNTHINQDNTNALKNIMKNRDVNVIVEQTWKILSNQGKVFIPPKVKKYLEYTLEY